MAVIALLPGMVADAQTTTYGNGDFGSGKYGGASATPPVVSPLPTGGGDLISEQLEDLPSTTSPAATTSIMIATTTPMNIGTTTVNTPATSSPSFTKNLGLGTKNEDIRKLQSFFSRCSDFYPDKYVTGYFGSATNEAVVKFQAAYKLPQTGFVGPLTIRKLNELTKTACEPKPVEKSVKSPEELKKEIEALQGELLKIVKIKVGQLKSAVELLLNKKL